MPYVTHLQLAERPGARELAQVASADHKALVDYGLMDVVLRGEDQSAWSPTEQAAAAAALARIDEAVLEADSTIDGFLAKRGYTLPLSPVPPVVAGWSRAIGRYLLHKGRQSLEANDPIVRDYRDALKLLQLVVDGKFSLGADDPVATGGAGGQAVFESDATVFGRDQLQSFR